ncbi:hypothetical protein CLOM_g2228 [Closterium sp. NIES-68]|nr:hypothetical protein CLOM_g2228 [Closterium sp. NIES-68]
MTKSSKGHASKGLWGMHLDVLRGTSDKLVCLLLPDGSMEMFGEGKTVADILAAYPGYHVGSLTSSRPRLAPQKALHPGSTYYLTPDLTPGVAAAASRGNGPFSPGVTREGVTPHLRRESATYLRTAEEFGDVANDVAWLREERPPARRVSLDPGSLQRHASRTTGARQIPSGDLFTGRDPFTGLATTHEESQSQPAQVSASMVRAALTGSRMHACEEEQPGSYVELGRNVPVCGNIACQAPECNPNMLADSSGGAATFPDFAGCYNIDERVCDTRRVVRKVPALHSELNFRESCREWEPIRPATSNPPDRSPNPTSTPPRLTIPNRSPASRTVSYYRISRLDLFPP